MTTEDTFIYSINTTSIDDTGLKVDDGEGDERKESDEEEDWFS